jgi:hypothetical protein
MFYTMTSSTVETVISMGSVQSACKRSEFRRKFNIKGLNFVAVKHTTVQVSRLPLWQEQLIIEHDLLY